MANVLIFDEGNGKVLKYMPSIDEGPYLSRSDVLIHPDLTAVNGLPEKYWLVKAGLVVAMNQAEKDAIDAPEIASAAAMTALRDSIRTKLKAHPPGLTDEEVDYLIAR